MKYIWIVFLSCILGLVACAPSANAVNTAIAQTQTALPLPTPTAPFSAIDLEPLLIQVVDFLPPNYSGVQFVKSLPSKYESLNIPVADYMIRQDIERDRYSSGFVTILLYESQDSLEEAYYKLFSDKGESKPLDGVGRKGQIFSSSLAVPPVVLKWVELLFVQCGALVDISLTGTDNEQDVITYAEPLARSLEVDPFVCR